MPLDYNFEIITIHLNSILFRKIPQNIKQTKKKHFSIYISYVISASTFKKLVCLCVNFVHNYVNQFLVTKENDK